MWRKALYQDRINSSTEGHEPVTAALGRQRREKHMSQASLRHTPSKSFVENTEQTRHIQLHMQYVCQIFN